MTLKSRLEKLERKTRHNQPVRHAPPLINPTQTDIERAHRQYPGATLFIVEIGPPPR
jgi:hypothetical protein